MLALWVKVRVKPEERERFLKAIEVDALGSEGDEPGCMRFNVLQDAQDEFRDRTGGGVGGTKWMAPLLPKNFKPPVDLRWPEYIHTARGEEWWIPTPAVGSGAGELL